jgi:hypothetical protein
MSALSRRGLLVGAAVSAGVGLTASPVLAQASAKLIVPAPPPAPRVEVIPDIQAERRDREYWQPGYWKWNGHGHDWYEGRYVVRPRTGAVWVPGHWERRSGGWIYIEGHWS